MCSNLVEMPGYVAMLHEVELQVVSRSRLSVRPQWDRTTVGTGGAHRRRNARG